MGDASWLDRGVRNKCAAGCAEKRESNRAKAARLLSTTERIFNYRVRKYGIDWRRFKG
jgi:transcriptional regulator with GAF, ATPase, and Fis domain